MSTPPASPAQPHEESDWIMDESPADAPANGSSNKPAGELSEGESSYDEPAKGVPIQDGYSSNEYSSAPDLNDYIQDDQTQTGYDGSDYLQDELQEEWRGGAGSADAGHGYNAVREEPPTFRQPHQARPRSMNMVQALLVVLALSVIVALAATVAFFKPDSIARLLPGVREAAVPAAAALPDSADSAVDAAAASGEPSTNGPANATTQASNGNDVFVVADDAAADAAVEEAAVAENAGEANTAEYNPAVNSEASPPSAEDEAARADGATAASEERADADAGDSATSPTPERIASTPSAAQLFVQAAAAFSNGEWFQAAQFYEQVRALDVGYQQERVEENLLLSYNNAAEQLLSEEFTDISTVESALQLYRSVLALNPDDETAQAQSASLNSFIVGDRALRLGDPGTAVERLAPFLTRGSEDSSALGQFTADRLYEAYLLLGDEAMRAGAVDLALENFNNAAVLDVADSSALTARLASLVRLDLADVALLNTDAQTFLSSPLLASSTASDTVTTSEVATSEADASEETGELLAENEPTAADLPVQPPAPTAAPPVAEAAPPPPVVAALPPLAATETPEPEAVAAPASPPATSQRALAPAACPDQRAVIARPLAGAVVSGVVNVAGSATHEAFSFYKLEFIPAGGEVVAWFAGGQAPVQSGSLGSWDSTLQPNGDYTLRLTVVDASQNYPPPCEVRVLVQN